MGNKDEDILYAVSFFVYAASLSIVLFASLIFIKKQNDSKSGASINILFSVSIVLLLIHLIFGAIANSLHFTPHAIPERTLISIHYSTGILFYLILLATLVLRLHITFKESAFGMTTRTIYLFSILLIVCIIAAIVAIIGMQLQCSNFEETVNIGLWMSGASGIVYWTLYFVGSTAAVWYFVGNLSKLTELRITSPRAVTLKADDVSLDSTQQRMVNVSAKYILLFLVAILSTLFTNIGNMTVYSMFLHQHLSLYGIVNMVWTLDLCLNFICLYLQFSFAAEHYRLFCGCLDNVCRNIVSRRTKTAIHRESMSRCDMPPTISPSTQSGHATVHCASDIKTPK